VDDSVDPGVATAANAGSVAAQPDTVVRSTDDAEQDQTLNSDLGSSREPVTVSRSSPGKSSSSRSSVSGATPPPASPASLAASSRPASPRWVPAETVKKSGSVDAEPASEAGSGAADGNGVAEAAAVLSSAPNESVKVSLPIPKSDLKAAADGAPAAYDDTSGRPISPSGNAALPPPVNDTDGKSGNPATLAAAALGGDQAPAPGYTPAGYSDYAPAGYSSSRDSMWPGTSPAGTTSARPASAGFPPAGPDSSRLSAGFVPVDPVGPGAQVPARPSSIWTSQEPTTGKIGYSPSGTQRPDVGASSAAAAGAAAGAAAAGIAATNQFPGRLAASQPAQATPSVAGDLVSKLKSPFTTAPKKRKPTQNSRPINASSLGIAAAVRTKPESAKRPAASPSPSTSAPNSRFEEPESRKDAQLVLSRIEPWSVMKFSFIISLVGWVILVVAVALLYEALKAFGVFHYLEQTVSTVTASKGNAGENAGAWFSTSTVLGYTMLVGAVNVVMFTALATVGSVIYNLVTHIAGGVEVTLREAD
jgi:hypothetical protein